jgi:isoquinoline 1-oxidoreductase subunit alpha
MTSLLLNGHAIEVTSEPDTPLLWVLRGELKLTGTKFGCGVAACGACTVHVDGQPVRSCVTPLSAIGARRVTTIEGLSGREAQALHSAWSELDVVQCGYCQTGQLMSACALLRATPLPTDHDIDQAMAGNICRRAAIHAAADSAVAHSATAALTPPVK